jgi:asparagine synthase (glutamine-hydrolysing)
MWPSTMSFSPPVDDMTALPPSRTKATPGTLGDVLILFGSAREPRLGRDPDESWIPAARGDRWRMLEQAATDGWKGFPRLHLSDEHRPCWLIGEVYGRSRATPGRRVREVVDGTRSAADLNGHFLLLAHDRPADEWHVWTSRFGTIHCYRARSGDRAALGTFAPVVAEAASARRLDWPALTAFCSVGFFPDTHTQFEDVHLLRPASHYVFGRDGAMLRGERYWNWWHRPDPARSYEDTVDRFAAVLDEVLDDVTSARRIAVPISGGLDSRTAVASLTRGTAPDGLQERLRSYSYGYTPDSIETRIAREIAAARALPFASYTVRPYLFDHLDQVMACVTGFQDVTQSRQASVAADLAGSADRVVAAHWGDVWLGDMGLADADPGRMSEEQVLEHVFRRIAKPGGDWLVDRLCRPHLGGADPAEVVRRFLRQGLADVAHIGDLDFRVKAFKTDHWSFRWTLASLRAFQPAAFPLLPFYDTRLADFFCTVPTSMVRGRRLQIDYLRRHAPDLASITWEARDLDLFRLDGWAPDVYVRRALRRARHLTTGERPIQRNWELQFLSPGGMEALRSCLLQPGLALHEMIEPTAIAGLLQSLEDAPDRERGYAASMLLTLSAWLERYG